MLGTPAPDAASTDPVALGEALFTRVPPGASAAIRSQPGVNLVGPSLAGIGDPADALRGVPSTRARRRRRRLHPRIDPEPARLRRAGPDLLGGGQSLMPAIFGATLKPEQIDELVAYLTTLK